MVNPLINDDYKPSLVNFFSEVTATR